MKVREIMSAPVYTCQPETDLGTVAGLMWDHDCGVVPVVDPTGAVVGVVTDRDICIAAATRRLPPERISASQAMSTSTRACLPDDEISEALATMKRFQIRRLPVIDDHGMLHGLLSMNDVTRASEQRQGPPAKEIVSALAKICEHRTIAAA